METGIFINENFLLPTDAAKELYHQSAQDCPIIDFHCHLNPAEIAHDLPFSSITSLWLGGDHYKWRAMRANGIDERFITGEATEREKFIKWAETVPYTMRNPLYHWTHLELKRVFGTDLILNPETAGEIYDLCNGMLDQGKMTPRSIMQRFNVKLVCTTDDPADSLEHHIKLAGGEFPAKVLPTWRPDNILKVDDPTSFRSYIERLSQAAGIDIKDYRSLMDAFSMRHDYFHWHGCRVSDHGLDTFYGEEFTASDMERIFQKAICGKSPDAYETSLFRSGILHELAVMDAEKGWIQQFHIGPIRNNNTKMFEKLGADSGFDAIDDKECAASGHRFFDSLARRDKLAKTVIYNLNPKDFEVFGAMAGTFNEGPTPGKMQLGSGWWFLDNEQGMRKQIDTISSLGLLARFVGMLTDSRSFLSYPRHEYFRRILCDVLGHDIETGRIPRSEIGFIHEMVKDISYRNACRYFGFPELITH